MNPVQRTTKSEINSDKGFVKFAVVDAIGSLMLGLGLYGKFAVNGDAFHPLLNNSTVVNSLLVMGVLVMMWGGFNMLKVLSNKAKEAKLKESKL